MGCHIIWQYCSKTCCFIFFVVKSAPIQLYLLIRLKWSTKSFIRFSLTIFRNNLKVCVVAKKKRIFTFIDYIWFWSVNDIWWFMVKLIFSFSWTNLLLNNNKNHAHVGGALALTFHCTYSFSNFISLYIILYLLVNIIQHCPNLQWKKTLY